MEGPRRITPKYMLPRKMGHTITAEDVNNHFSGLMEALRKNSEEKVEDGNEQEDQEEQG